MSDPYFQALDESSDGGRYASLPATAGPWAQHLQHGGPPNALAVRAAGRAVRAATGRDDLIALRLASDFVGPVPVAPLEVTARVVRAARSAALAEVEVSAAGRACLFTRVWFVRTADTSTLADTQSEPPPAPPPIPDAPGADGGTGLEFGYGASLDWRFLRGAMSSPGRGVTWVRPRVPLVEVDGAQQDAVGLERVVLVADSGSGVSAELDWSVWSFVNVDLDVHLARPMSGEWVLLDSVSQLGGSGSALARSTISDVDGLLGTGLQTLVLAPLPAR